MSAGAILLAENNPITRKMLRAALEIEGYDVVEVENGRQALEASAARVPDLMVLDYMLPDMDGLWLLAEIRGLAPAQDMPAVVVTGMVSRLDELRAEGGSNTQFLVKPVEPAQLVDVVRAQLSAAPGPTAGKRLLVVDDQPRNLKLAKFWLGRAGYEVETASGGEEALEIARRRPPDAILTDVLMPSMDGFAFCREARRHPALAAIPIVLVSAAYVDEADRDLARQMGANALVVQTPDLGDAVTALEAALRKAAIPSPTSSDEKVTALHRERLQVQLERQTARNEALLREAAIQATALSVVRGVSEVLAHPRDVPEILGDVLVHCLDAAGLSTGLLYVAEPGGRHRLRASFGIPADRKADAATCFGHPELIHRIVASGPPAALLSSAATPDGEVPDFLARLGHSSVLILPVVVLGQNFGALVLASDSHDLSERAWLGFAHSLALQFGQTVALGQSVKRLAASEGRYRALMEHANDAILILDPTARVVEVNRETERLLGRPRAEIVGRHYDDFAVPDEPAGSAQWQAQLLTAGTLRVGEHRLARGDGTPVWVEVSVSLVRLGEESTLLTIIHDITERKRSEEAHRASEEQYRLLFDSNPHPMWVYDEETLAFLAVNDAAVRQYGYSRDEFLAMGALDIRPPEEVPALREEYEAFIAQEQPGRSYRSPHTMTHRRKDGAVIEVDVAANRIVFEGRKGWVVLATDVTEKRSLEAQLQQSQKMEAMGRLAGGVAHDFNNLLGIITGYGDLLRRKIAPETGLLKYVEDILKAAARAAGLTRQLLAFSRKQVLQAQVLDLNAVVAETETMLRRLIGEDIQLVTVLADQLGPVRGDPGQIDQVLMNLAVNARDAMPRGGRLTIESRNVVLDQAYASQHPGVEAGSHVMLAVSDTGHGMTPDVQARLFEPFFTTKEPGKGTGLGLATVHGIVKQSGGHIWVYSEPGQGTTFKVYLPRADAPGLPVEEPLPAPVGLARGSETILLVEDEASLREIVRECLEAAGYKVLEASHGTAALEAGERYRGRIDLLLTDVVMPGMSGRELADHLRGPRPEMCTIYMSGYTDDAVVLHGVLAKEMAFLQKPFTEAELARRVREELDRPAGR